MLPAAHLARRVILVNSSSLDIVVFDIVQKRMPLTWCAASLKSTGLVLSLELLACLITCGRGASANMPISSSILKCLWIFPRFASSFFFSWWNSLCRITHLIGSTNTAYTQTGKVPGKETWVNIEVVEHDVGATVWNALSVEQDLGLPYCCWGIFDVEMFEAKLWLVIQGCDTEFQ